jgi:hypothetical protein
MNDSFLFLVFKLMKLKLSAEQKPVKLLWVAYLSRACLFKSPKGQLKAMIVSFITN